MIVDSECTAGQNVDLRYLQWSGVSKETTNPLDPIQYDFSIGMGETFATEDRYSDASFNMPGDTRYLSFAEDRDLTGVSGSNPDARSSLRRDGEWYIASGRAYSSETNRMREFELRMQCGNFRIDNQ